MRPHFLGHIVHHLVLDARDRRTLLAAARTGHLGPPVFRSTGMGRSWQEAARPPAFDKAKAGEAGRAVDHTFWLTPAHANEPNVWYAGTSPQGLFRSEDGGITWHPFSSINDDPDFRRWMGTVQDGTPDGPKLHSISVDPRDPAHLYIAMSGSGVHETRDKGRTWAALLGGLEVVEGFNVADPAFHDPHCVRLCPSNPDRLYQQNHCGIYRLDRPGTTWVRIGQRMPKRVGDIGLPLVVHPRDAETAWVFPMDGYHGLTAHQPGGCARRLCHARQRPALAAAGRRLSRRPGVVDGEAPGARGRHPGPGRPLPRHHQRRAVGEPERGRTLALPGAAPARNLRGRGGRAVTQELRQGTQPCRC